MRQVGQYFTVTLVNSGERRIFVMMESGCLTLLNGLSNPELLEHSRCRQSAPQMDRVDQGPGFVEEFQGP